MSRIVQTVSDLARRKFLRRSAAVAAIRVISLIAVFAMQVLLARLVGDNDEYGKYAWGQSLLYMVGTLAAMGVPVVASRFITSLSAQGLEGNSSQVIRRSHVLLLYSAGATVLVAAAVYLLSDVIPGENIFTGIAALALLFAPVQSFGLLYQNLSQGRHWMIAAFLPLQVIRPLMIMLLAFLAWRVGGIQLDGSQLVILVGISLMLNVLASGSVYYFRHRKLLAHTGATTGHAPDFAADRIMGTAKPIFATRLATQFIEYSNVLLVGFLAGPAAAGAYFAAERLAMLARMPGRIFGQVAQPEFAAAFAREDKPGLRWVVWRTTHMVFWPTAVGVAILATLATPLLSIFGEGFEAGHMALVILALNALLLSAFGPVNILMLMTGQQDVMPLVHWTTAIFHGICLALLVPTYGAAGAAMTTLLSTALSGTWLILLVRRHLDINPTVFTPTRPEH
ncbi:MAG: lipopolysaccharide biosynthesis protein [Halioglobus sp.]